MGRSAQRPSLRRPGRLAGLGFVILEMADEALACESIDEAQQLVELAMSAFATATHISPDLQACRKEMQAKLDATVAAIRPVLRPPDDPADAWPYGDAAWS